MNLARAINQSNNDAWIARKFNMTEREVAELRKAMCLPLVKISEDVSQYEQEWEEHAKAASAQLRDAVRLYLDRRAAEMNLPELDWIAFDARMANRECD